LIITTKKEGEWLRNKELGQVGNTQTKKETIMKESRPDGEKEGPAHAPCNWRRERTSAREGTWATDGFLEGRGRKTLLLGFRGQEERKKSVSSARGGGGKEKQSAIYKTT